MGNHSYRYYWYAILACYAHHNIQSVDLYGKTFLHTRSQNVNMARRIVGIKSRLYHDNASSVISITPSYGNSFRPYRIAEYFFSTEYLDITGSSVANRQPDHLLADHFGLSPGFNSTVQLIPSNRNGLIDFYYHGSYKCWYLQLSTPYVWTRNYIEILEDIHDTGINTPFPPLYFDQAAITSPGRSFTQAIQDGIQVGDLNQPLRFGKMGCPQTKKGLADIAINLGWYYIQKKRTHLSFYLHTSIPTGNRPTGVYLLEPIIGNGHHMELGAGFSGHIILWEKDFEQTLGLYVTFQASHLFATHQQRSFDFCKQGFASRYLLLKEFNESKIYTKNLLPAINTTTLSCNVHNSVEFELLCMAGYRYNCWDVDLGYSAWLRSKDVIRLSHHCTTSLENQYGFKGTQNVRTLLDVDNNTQSNTTITGIEMPIVDIPSPQLIQISDLDIKSAANPQAFTHKIFGHIGYSFMEQNNSVQPFVGIGGEIEFESIRRRELTEPNKNCISQWAIWFKLGISFI